MLRPLLIAGALGLALATGPALAQQDKPPAAQAEPQLVGLPIYSSDGEKLGEVTQVGMSGGQPAVQAEMSADLGIGAKNVIIDAGLFEQKPDRIELSMTAAEVKSRLSKQ